MNQTGQPEARALASDPPVAPDPASEGQPASSGAPRSSRSEPRGLLQIQDTNTGRIYHHALAQRRVLIGREPTADLVLDSPRISPLHAELVCDPFGRWWIHDLSGKKGITVHGQTVQERLLGPGDEVTLGEFRLWLRSKSSAELRLGLPAELGSATSRQPASALASPSAELIPAETAPVRPRRPGLIQAGDLWKVMALGRKLMQLEELPARRSLVCRFLLEPDLPGEVAAVLRLQDKLSVQAVEGPLCRTGAGLVSGLSERIIRQLWETRQPVFVPAGQTTTGRLFAPSRRAVVVCPLRAEDDSLESLYVELAAEFGGPEWCSLVVLVAEAFQQAELVWEMRTHLQLSLAVESELEMARQIQQGLVPRQAQFDSVPQALDVAIGFEPCRWVGGDYADAISMPDGRVLLAIADVCGKGLQAALVASSLHTLVRANADTVRSLPSLMERINRHLCRYLPDHVFVTMLAVAVDLRTGELEVISAGHLPALVADPSGEVWPIQVGHNLPLGIADTTMHSGTCVLGSDQVLLLYTDGLTEAVDEHRMPLGIERLIQYLAGISAASTGRGLAVMRDELLERLRRYRGGRLTSDDTTFLLARRRLSLPPPAGTWKRHPDTSA